MTHFSSPFGDNVVSLFLTASGFVDEKQMACSAKMTVIKIMISELSRGKGGVTFSELCPVSLSRNIDDALIDAMRTQLATSEIRGASLHAEHHSRVFFVMNEE